MVGVHVVEAAVRPLPLAESDASVAIGIERREFRSASVCSTRPGRSGRRCCGRADRTCRGCHPTRCGRSTRCCSVEIREAVGRGHVVVAGLDRTGRWDCSRATSSPDSTPLPSQSWMANERGLPRHSFLSIMPTRGIHDVLERVRRVGVVDEHRERLALVDHLEAAGTARSSLTP